MSTYCKTHKYLELAFSISRQVNRRHEPSQSEQFVLQGHVRFRLKANTGTEDVRQGRTLLGQRIDHRRSRRGQRGL